MKKRKIVTAEINYVCHGCLDPIKKGDEYELTTVYSKVRRRLCMECSRTMWMAHGGPIKCNKGGNSNG